MKKSLLIAFVVLCAASTAFAQAGSIGIFTSAAATDCALTQPGVNFTAQYTLVHTGTGGATGSGAAAPIPPCAGGLIITDIQIAPVYLSAVAGQPGSQAGFSAGYGSCRVGPIAIANMFYQALFPVTGCCVWAVTENTAIASTPISTDCQTPIQEEPCAGGAAVLSTNPAVCTCSTPTHESTWGGVKELFRQGI